MPLFLVVFLAVYGSLHVYLFLKVRAAFAPGLPAQLGLAAFLLVMLASPILVNLVAHPFPRIGYALSLIGFPWVALVFWFFSFGVVVDLWNLSRRLLFAGTLAVPARTGVLALFALIAILAVWGWFEARSIRLERITVASASLPPGSPPITVAQVSDLHLGLLVRDGTLDRVIRLVKEARPDILVSTGDLVDVTADSCCDVVGRFSEINPPEGKFAVLGNHEYYAGLERSITLIGLAGFQLLRQSDAVVAGGRLRIVGVDDPAGQETGRDSRLDEGAILPPAGPPREAVLFLKHRPQIEPGSLGRFDLQLSGHTHKGQIFPFNIPVKLAWKYASGLRPLAHGSTIYTSRGTGTWGPPFRVFSRPEVTLITLVPK